MGGVKDITGLKFGRLTVIKRYGSNKYGRALWLCKCECGNEVVVRGHSLRRGDTTSCGCYQKDKTKERWEDEEFKQKQKNGTKAKWKDEEYRQMQSNKMKEKWNDKDFRQMQSEQRRRMNEEQWQDEEFRQMKSKQMKEIWKDEDMKWKMNYKGGISPISTYLRSLPIVSQWIDDCKKQVNYTCELTGKVGVKLHTHHLKAFNTIVLEAHELYDIEIKKQVKDYNEEELHKLEEYVASWHKDTSNAVVLCEEVHTLFHSLYGKGNNTKEQYIEFKERKQRGDI